MTLPNHDNLCDDFRKTAPLSRYEVSIRNRTSLHFNGHKAAHYVLLNLFGALKSKYLRYKFSSKPQHEQVLRDKSHSLALNTG